MQSNACSTIQGLGLWVVGLPGSLDFGVGAAAVAGTCWSLCLHFFEVCRLHQGGGLLTGGSFSQEAESMVTFENCASRASVASGSSLGKRRVGELKASLCQVAGSSGQSFEFGGDVRKVRHSKTKRLRVGPVSGFRGWPESVLGRFSQRGGDFNATGLARAVSQVAAEVHTCGMTSHRDPTAPPSSAAAAREQMEPGLRCSCDSRCWEPPSILGRPCNQTCATQFRVWDCGWWGFRAPWILGLGLRPLQEH